MISHFLHKGYGYLIKMNERNSGVPVLLYEETATYFLATLVLKETLYVLNVCALMHVLMTQGIMRSK